MEMMNDPYRLAKKETRITPTISVAHGVMVGIVALAAFLRLAGLGELPLNSAEASHALATFNFLHSLPALDTSVSPAYFALSVLLQLVLGNSDATARLAPALIGSASVGLLWLLRPRLGTMPTLIASVLLAVSPLHVALSRTASGDALALFALLLLLVCALNPRWQPTTRRTLSAVAFAFGLTTSPLFYTGLFVLSVAIGFKHAKSPPKLQSAERKQWQQAGLIAVITFVGLATLFFSHPSGLGASADQLAQAIMQFGFSKKAFTPLLAVARYEPIPLLLGSIALFLSSRQNATAPPVTNLLRLLIALGLALTLLQAGTKENVLLWLLPLYLLLGQQFAGWIGEQVEKKVWLVGVVTFPQSCSQPAIVNS
ncbi:MAG TPA: hypothetical protein ENJ56_05515 [Anaerolineae bacterium]|nr:hypothetical protein [Anaerolineae bacterium]